MSSQDRPHGDVILADQFPRCALSVPIGAILIVPCELYAKKPRLSLRTLMWRALIRPVCLAATALLPYIEA